MGEGGGEESLRKSRGSAACVYSLKPGKGGRVFRGRAAGWGGMPARTKKGPVFVIQLGTPRCAEPAEAGAGLPVPPPAPGRVAAPPPDQSKSRGR